METKAGLAMVNCDSCRYQGFTRSAQSDKLLRTGMRGARVSAAAPKPAGKKKPAAGKKAPPANGRKKPEPPADERDEKPTKQKKPAPLPYQL